MTVPTFLNIRFVFALFFSSKYLMDKYAEIEKALHPQKSNRYSLSKD
jgi:hypothetical protein